MKRILAAILDTIITLGATAWCGIHLVHEHSPSAWWPIAWLVIAVPAVAGGRRGPRYAMLTYFAAALTLYFAAPHDSGSPLEHFQTGALVLAAPGLAFLTVGVIGDWVTAATRAWTHPRGGQKIISLSGFAQSGKDTAAGFLVEDGWHRIAFADKLKDVAYDLNPWVKTNGALMIRLAELVDKAGWDAAKAHDDVRELLQRLGVAGREHISADMWIAAAFADMPADRHVVITDARFPNELEAVRRMGGMLVRVEREGTGPVNTHASESAWNDTKFHVLIRNNASVERLAFAIRYLGTVASPRRRMSRPKA